MLPANIYSAAQSFIAAGTASRKTRTSLMIYPSFPAP